MSGAGGETLDELIAALMQRAGISPEEYASLSAKARDALLNPPPEPLVPHQDFERWYADVRTPAPTTLHSALHSDMSAFFAPSGHVHDPDFHIDRKFVELARANDIKGLERAVESPLAAKALEEARRGDRPAITYCVSHMLVDNGGNEEFARRWLENHGHQRRLAHKRASGSRILNDHSKVAAQHALGLSTLVDFFAHDERSPAPFLNFCNRKDSREFALFQSNIIAGVLRMQHPKEPPIVDYRDEQQARQRKNLVQALWHGGDQLNCLLPCIERAYGRGNPFVEGMTDRALFHLVHEKKLTFAPKSTSDGFWEAIRTWASKEQACDIWHARQADDDSLIKELSTSASLVTFARIELMRELGADIDAVVDGKSALGHQSQTLLHRAIAAKNTELVAHLLQNDCDPTKVMKTKLGDGLLTMTGVELANLSDDEASLHIASMIRSAVASRAAHDVLRELGVEPPRGLRP